MKILLLAYSCFPGHGSEPEVGWNWASRLPEQHDVYLLTHTHCRERLTAELAARPRPRLRVHFVQLPLWIDPLPGTYREAGSAVRYALWQAAAFLFAAKLSRAVRFDVVHHVSWTTADGPTFMWALGLPFVWGPLGGGQRAPLQLRRYLGAGWWRETLRNCRVWAARFNPLSHLTARTAQASLSCNPETTALLEWFGARNVELMGTNAIDPDWGPREAPRRERREAPIVLWIGRLDHRKATNLAIEAFANVRRRRAATLWICGDGHLMADLKALARELGVEADVQLLGRVPHDELPRRMAEADVFMFTSLRDSYPDAVLQAMACALPVLSLDHQGVAPMNDEAVRKVPVRTADQVVGDLAAALFELLDDFDLRQRMGRAAWQNIQEEHLWPGRVARMNRIYRSAVGADRRA
jgi:glycosyltransferase involved in cell wall biosynthesis